MICQSKTARVRLLFSDTSVSLESKKNIICILIFNSGKIKETVNVDDGLLTCHLQSGDGRWDILRLRNGEINDRLIYNNLNKLWFMEPKAHPVCIKMTRIKR